MSNTEYPLLSQIEFPADLRKFNEENLAQISDELREFIIDIVSKKGGHFGASLGVVELTVALHYVFNTPEDQLVWDVGHQAYGHKILTGRKHQFHTNRVYKGLSGFPKRKESEYDAFGVGHSSTSISAILGMAIAAKENNPDKKPIKPSQRIDIPAFCINGMPTIALNVKAVIATVSIPLGVIKPI